ncbi:MAG: hypothetical protein ACK4QL_08655 [Pseudanabaenaceae cyanobacterium]
MKRLQGVGLIAGVWCVGQNPLGATPIDIDPRVIEGSSVLQRWLNNPPDLLEDIYNYPSFSTKFRLGFISRDNRLGLDIGAEDIFLGRSPLTISGSYQTLLPTPEASWDIKARYYLLPLGSYWNVAPQVGYRQVNTAEGRSLAGLEVGLQAVLALSPRSSDLRISHSFTNLGTDQELSVTALTASYALGRHFWLGSTIEWRRSPLQSDSRVGFSLQWSLP